MLPPPPPSPDQPLALFLDFDGTLVELAEQPDAVVVPGQLLDRLGALHDQLDGALAVVSGRRLANLLEHLQPLSLPAAGNHGLEYQLLPGQVEYLSALNLPTAARARLEQLVATHPGLLLEAKGQSVAIHYRQAPELADSVENAVRQIRDEDASDFLLQPGKMVWEMRPKGADKGTAIETFMQSDLFSGRLPVFIGDDRTDEFGFRAVQTLGGWSIHVGLDPRRTTATMGLPDVTAVLVWLDALSAGLARDSA